MIVLIISDVTEKIQSRILPPGSLLTAKVRRARKSHFELRGSVIRRNVRSGVSGFSEETRKLESCMEVPSRKASNSDLRSSEVIPSRPVDAHNAKNVR